MRLILVRHGETESNRERLTLGRADVPLNERGRLQAAALASAFSTPPAMIYSSPLQRASETARAIAVATGAKLLIEPDLVEMDVGEMEHFTREKLRATYPEFLATWLSAAAGDARMPGGETLREVQARAWAAVERMRLEHEGQRVVVVSHNFVILTLLCQALNLPLGEFRRLRQSLAGRTIVDIGETTAALVQLNDIAHLLGRGLAEDPSGSEG